ncbi:MAG: ATP-binding cassette domain-containing protein [Acidimicrobiia bacterium]
MTTPFIEIYNVSKYFGNVIALKDVSARLHAGEVTCVLGDNGAGKSSLIKILAGVHQPDEGGVRMEGKPVIFPSPREALAHGIATVYQDLALVPLMSVWRNFFLGNEPVKGAGLLRRLDVERAKREVSADLAEMGIHIRDPEQPVGTMSGGERQSLAIARAVYYGAKVLILDEPTAALGVKQASIVLRHVMMAKKRGLAVIFITHNPNHAYPVGDHFVILRRGKMEGDFRKEDLPLEHLMHLMAGGEDLEELSRELERVAAETGDKELASTAEEIEAELEEIGRREGS